MKHVLNSPAANGFHLADLKFHEIAHLVIEPNSELSAHSLSIDVTFYVIEEKGRVTIDHQPYEASRRRCRRSVGNPPVGTEKSNRTPIRVIGN